MNKRLVILGGGESGVGAAILAKKEGFDVFLSDIGNIASKYKEVLHNHNILFEEGKHTQELILNASEVIKSPGIPDKAPLIKKLKQQETKIISEIEFASRYCRAKKICITGSNGKTTTSTMCYYLLKEAGLNVGLAGNIGKSYAWQVAECNFDYYVLELSSFQLDGMYDFKADIAIILNITPDHLDRYNYEFQNYVDSKFRILQNQTNKDFVIYWNGDLTIEKEIIKRDIKAKCLPFGDLIINGNGAFVAESNIIFKWNKTELTMSIYEIELKGKHNTYNSMAAGLVGKVLGIKDLRIRESLSAFSGVEHRLESFKKLHNVEYINDSKATNVNSTWYALESINKPIVWIVGGIDKGNNYEELDQLVKQKVKAIVCLGVDNTKITQHFKSVVKDIVEVKDMKSAVKAASFLAEDGNVVLLSPACASFDLFDNYEDRGRKFKASVLEL